MHRSSNQFVTRLYFLGGVGGDKSPESAAADFFLIVLGVIFLFTSASKNGCIPWASFPAKFKAVIVDGRHNKA